MHYRLKYNDLGFYLESLVVGVGVRGESPSKNTQSMAAPGAASSLPPAGFKGHTVPSILKAASESL